MTRKAPLTVSLLQQVEAPASPATSRSWEDIRQDFDILDQSVQGKQLIYFDTGSTSQKPRQVTDAMDSYYARYGLGEPQKQSGSSI